MGRMADARKRAKRTDPSPDSVRVDAEPVPPPGRLGAEERPPGDEDFTFPPEEPVEEAPVVQASRPPAPEPTTWVAREESFAVPEPPPLAVPRTKIVLPASGLASDILALAESASIPAAPARSGSEEMVPLA